MPPLRIEVLPGAPLGHSVTRMERIGAYEPGGRHPRLPAPVMIIAPAEVAGVEQVIACPRPNAHDAVVAGCHLPGADRIFRIGGAQAIAAMAYGTRTAPAVDEIVGPGDAPVGEAERQVSGRVGIHRLACPSEICVPSDGTGDPETIVADLPARAEHDARTRVGLLTTSAALATAGRARAAEGEIALAEDEGAVVAFSDHVAAEPLEVRGADPDRPAGRVRNGGSLLIGEPAGVVYSGKCCVTDNAQPTMAAGRAVAPPALRRSVAEGVGGHRRAAQQRLERLRAGQGSPPPNAAARVGPVHAPPRRPAIRSLRGGPSPRAWGADAARWPDPPRGAVRKGVPAAPPFAKAGTDGARGPTPPARSERRPAPAPSRWRRPAVGRAGARRPAVPRTPAARAAGEGLRTVSRPPSSAFRGSMPPAPLREWPRRPPGPPRNGPPDRH